MLQSFLQLVIAAMEQGVMLTVPLGILLAIILPLKDSRHAKIFRRMLKWGFFLSLFMVVVKSGTRQAVSREVFEAMAIAVDAVSAVVLVAILVRDREWSEATNRAFGYGVGALTLGLFLYHGMELWLLPINAFAAGQGEYFTLAMLVKMLGFATGLILGFLAGFLAYKAADALNHRRLIFVFTVQIIAALVQQLVFFLQVLMARQLFGTEKLISFMAPVIDRQSWMIFIVFAMSVLVPVTLFLQPKPEKPAWANPAEYRKILAAAIRKRRWGTGLSVMLVVLILLSSVGSYYANKQPELVPAVNVQAVNGAVSIPLSEVEDGHLHRYAYRASDGTQVRVIIIKKGGSAYGVGLDACDVCGPTGYYEDDNQVVCKLCNVIMNKATIGMPGGCNPVPVEHSISNGSVTIDAQILETERVRFR